MKKLQQLNSWLMQESYNLMFAFIVFIATRIPILILLIAVLGSFLYLLGELVLKQWVYLTTK